MCYTSYESQQSNGTVLINSCIYIVCMGRVQAILWWGLVSGLLRRGWLWFKKGHKANKHKEQEAQRTGKWSLGFLKQCSYNNVICYVLSILRTKMLSCWLQCNSNKKPFLSDSCSVTYGKYVNGANHLLINIMGFSNLSHSAKQTPGRHMFCIGEAVPKMLSLLLHASKRRRTAGGTTVELGMCCVTLKEEETTGRQMPHLFLFDYKVDLPVTSDWQHTSFPKGSAMLGFLSRSILRIALARKRWKEIASSRYLTEIEKSPWEFWLARMMKEPISLFMSRFSASWRDILPLNQLSNGTDHMNMNKKGELEKKKKEVRERENEWAGAGEGVK